MRRSDVPQVFTIAEVADMFGRKPRTVRGWIADGLLPHLKVGRSVFVPADALAKMVADAAARTTRKPQRRCRQGNGVNRPQVPPSQSIMVTSKNRS
jgi:excisionase family DNA binding protein